MLFLGLCTDGTRGGEVWAHKDAGVAGGGGRDEGVAGGGGREHGTLFTNGWKPGSMPIETTSFQSKVQSAVFTFSSIVTLNLSLNGVHFILHLSLSMECTSSFTLASQWSALHPPPCPGELFLFGPPLNQHFIIQAPSSQQQTS